MHLALSAAGPFDKYEVDRAAKSLYQYGIYENSIYAISLFCIGKQRNIDLERKYPKVPQITWRHILEFIYYRFTTYKEQKSKHSQWDCYGKKLYRFAQRSETKDIFIEKFVITSENNR